MFETESLALDAEAPAPEDAAKELDALGVFGRRGGIADGIVAGFYRDLDSTKQWAESHWDRVRTVGGPAPASLIAIDPFWLDLANSDLDQISVSSNLLRPVGNRHAALDGLGDVRAAVESWRGRLADRTR